jgi:hypothetical protein
MSGPLAAVEDEPLEWPRSPRTPSNPAVSAPAESEELSPSRRVEFFASEGGQRAIVATKIAPRYGISDRGLGNLCARAGIPVPSRGWWAKKAAGKRLPKQPELPLSFAKTDRLTESGLRMWLA